MRSRRGPRLVAERSPTSRRPIADQSPTSFNDSHAPILTKLIGDHRRLVGDFGDWSATSPGCLRPNQSQPGFCASTKTWLRLIWSQRGPRSVADFSATSPGPIGDLVATSAIGENCQFAERLQCMSDWDFSGVYK